MQQSLTKETSRCGYLYIILDAAAAISATIMTPPSCNNNTNCDSNKDSASAGPRLSKNQRKKLKATGKRRVRSVPQVKSSMCASDDTQQVTAKAALSVNTQAGGETIIILKYTISEYDDSLQVQLAWVTPADICASYAFALEEYNTV